MVPLRDTWVKIFSVECGHGEQSEVQVIIKAGFMDRKEELFFRKQPSIKATQKEKVK